MKNKRTLAAMLVVAGAVLVLAGGLMASNMGFKLNKSLTSAGGGSLSGTQTMGLPYNRQVGIDTAEQLFSDMGGYPTVQQISKWLTATDGLQSYTKGSADFPLAAGEGYQVKMGATTNYIIVGSHDPTLEIDLVTAGAGSLSGTQYFAPPYHATASTAQELFVELGGYPTVQQISRFLTASDGLQSYTKGTSDFPLAPGDAYQIKMGAPVVYTPSHY